MQSGAPGKLHQSPSCCIYAQNLASSASPTTIRYLSCSASGYGFIELPVRASAAMVLGTAKCLSFSGTRSAVTNSPLADRIMFSSIFLFIKPTLSMSQSGVPIMAP